jgi:hypothetical protein
VTAPKIEDVREAKDQLIKLLKAHRDFAGVGIGQKDGRLVVQVNWRKLPPDIVTSLDHIGDIEIRHQEVGDVRRQSGDPPQE